MGEAICEDLKDANALVQAAGLPPLQTFELAQPAVARRRTRTRSGRLRGLTPPQKVPEELPSETGVDLEAGVETRQAGVAAAIPASGSCLLGRSSVASSSSDEKPTSMREVHL